MKVVSKVKKFTKKQLEQRAKERVDLSMRLPEIARSVFLSVAGNLRYKDETKESIRILSIEVEYLRSLLEELPERPSMYLESLTSPTLSYYLPKAEVLPKAKKSRKR
jgi:hypothetical protein